MILKAVIVRMVFENRQKMYKMSLCRVIFSGKPTCVGGVTCLATVYTINKELKGVMNRSIDRTSIK